MSESQPTRTIIEMQISWHFYAGKFVDYYIMEKLKIMEINSVLDRKSCLQRVKYNDLSELLLTMLKF